MNAKKSMKKQGHIEIRNKGLVGDFNLLLTSTYNNVVFFQRLQKQKIEPQYCKALLKYSKDKVYSVKCHTDEFKVFGSGIYLLFKFVKILVIIFFSLSALNLAVTAIFVNGEEIADVSKRKQSFFYRMAQTTLGNCNQSNQLTASILYFITISLFSLSIIYWKERQEAEVISCSEKRLLPSYYTVILDPVPQGYSELQLKSYLNEHIGEVKQIFSAKQFHNDLLHYQQIDEIIRQFKIQFFTLKRQRETRNCLKLISLFREFYFHYLRMKSHKRDRYQPAFAFITFKQISSRQKLLAEIEQYNSCLKNSKVEQPDQILNKLSIKDCKMEPDGISWENITLPTKNVIFRFIFQITLLLVVLVISMFVIFLFALADYNLTNPSYSNYTIDEIMKMNNTIAVKYYCLSLSFSQFYSKQMCSDYTGESTKIICLQIALPIMISLLKFMFTELMKALVGVRRHPTQIKKYQSQIVITFIFFFIVSGLLQLVINLEITSNQNFYSIRHLFKTTFKPIYDIFPTDSKIILPNDFSREWYLWNSSKIILITLLSFNFTSVFNVIYSVLRKKIMIYLASKKQTLLEAQQYLKGQKLEIEFIYAFLLNIIYFALLYGPVMPLVWIFCSLAQLLLYWAHKFIFIRYCQYPLMFGHSINHLIIRMILFGIVFSSFFYPLMLGGKRQMPIGKRYITYIYYPILGGLILVYMFCKKIMLRLFVYIKNYCQGKFNVRNARLPSLICNIDSNSNQLPSYSMHQNKLYTSALKVLYTINTTQRNRATFLLNEQLSNLFESLKSDKDDSKDYFQDFVHLIKQDRNKFSRRYFSKSRLNPFGQNQKKVKQILKIYKQINYNSISRHRAKNRLNAKNFIQKVKSYELKDGIIENESDNQEQKDKNSDQNIESQRGFSQVSK